MSADNPTEVEEARAVRDATRVDSAAVDLLIARTREANATFTEKRRENHIAEKMRAIIRGERFVA